ncbi:MAG: DUF3990 domain-containing protein [Prevotellaceae bacterium]|jgi:hypothetical protein|nr:DUF3990 domain-containing protein [Prevotellaceae bacterium]
MKLYHGTNVRFLTPKIIRPNRLLDFGTGFYTTTDEKQASDWAKTVAKRTKIGQPLLNIYELDDNYDKQLKIKHFKSPTKEWLDFVCESRMNINFKDDNDLVIGPIANDTTIPTIQLYLNSIQSNPDEKDYFADFAIRLLRADRLKDQFVFKTPKSLKYITTWEIVKL